MNPVQKRVFIHIAQGCAVALPILFMAQRPAEAQEPTAAASCSSQGAQYDRRLMAKADEGVAPLVRYVHRMQLISQVDVTEALKRLDRQREAVGHCVGAENGFD